jgi:hypothetical protein
VVHERSELGAERFELLPGVAFICVVGNSGFGGEVGRRRVGECAHAVSLVMGKDLALRTDASAKT